ncbi:MAG TPA: glycosyltransferase [Candidatus Obscuribacterales bacterium]
MKLLIQHNHEQDEIAGVLTYINSIEPELNLRGIETQVISTKKITPKQWLQAVASADIIHMNSNHLVFAIFCKALGKKIILKYHYLFYLSIHSVYEPMSFVERLKTEFIYSLPKKKYPLKWKLHTAIKWLRLGTRLATALLVDRRTACSQFIADSNSLPWEVSTLYNPILAQNYQNHKSLDDLSTPYTFVFVGRLTFDKGIDILLKAIKIIRESSDKFQVLIIGDGGEASVFKTMASDLGISDCVKFLGKLSSTEIFPIVRSALALIVPSRWQEAAGYVVLEASSLQTCSLVAHVGGLPEIAGYDNLFFERENFQELANAMKRCLDNPSEAIERGKLANQYVIENFSPSMIADQLIEICRELSSSFRVSS